MTQLKLLIITGKNNIITFYTFVLKLNIHTDTKLKH